MASRILIIPDLIGEPSWLQGGAPAVADLAKRSEVGIIPSIDNHLCFELACLGVEAQEIPDGPLAVAALGMDPPADSSHYRITLLSLDDAKRLVMPTHRLSESQREEVFRFCKCLETRRLTLIAGHRDLQAMVLEDAAPDGITLSPTEACGKPLSECLPSGDDEAILRRFIDDSANILMDADFNLRRLDEGLEPISLLWPWGGGYRPICTNLALRRGPISVLTGSFRMAGAAKIVGLGSKGLTWFGSGINLDLPAIAEAAAEKSCAVYLDSFRHLRANTLVEEGEWLLREVDSKLVEPLVRTVAAEGGRLAIVSPCEGFGLWLDFDPGRHGDSGLPFDERAMDATRQNRRTISDIFAQVFGGTTS